MMTKRQQQQKALAIKVAAQEAARRMRAEIEEMAKPCQQPFCKNKRKHLVGSGKCKFDS
jgi:phage host-nuclease inhibitor protein Gam